MPRIKIEYTSNVPKYDYQPFLEGILPVIVDTLNADINLCKGYAQKIEDYYIGDGGQDNGFIHIDIAILEGRTAEMKRKCGEAVMKLARAFFKEALSRSKIQLTLWVHEMSKSDYYQ